LPCLTSKICMQSTKSLSLLAIPKNSAFHEEKSAWPVMSMSCASLVRVVVSAWICCRGDMSSRRGSLMHSCCISWLALFPLNTLLFAVHARQNHEARGHECVDLIRDTKRTHQCFFLCAHMHMQQPACCCSVYEDFHVENETYTAFLFVGGRENGVCVCEWVCVNMHK
jgi:hypothetical protein